DAFGVVAFAGEAIGEDAADAGAAGEDGADALVECGGDGDLFAVAGVAEDGDFFGVDFGESQEVIDEGGGGPGAAGQCAAVGVGIKAGEGAGIIVAVVGGVAGGD